MCRILLPVACSEGNGLKVLFVFHKTGTRTTGKQVP